MTKSADGSSKRTRAKVYPAVPFSTRVADAMLACPYGTASPGQRNVNDNVGQDRHRLDIMARINGSHGP